MDSGVLCVMTGSPGTMLTLLVDSWATPEDTAGGMWEP